MSRFDRGSSVSESKRGSRLQAGAHSLDAVVSQAQGLLKLLLVAALKEEAGPAAGRGFTPRVRP